MTKFAYSTSGRKSRYVPQTDKPDRYEVFWGTLGSKKSKRCKSIAIAKHPLYVWAANMRELAAKHGTPEELEEARRVHESIDNVGDIPDQRIWEVRIDSIGMRGYASLLRLPEQS